MLCWSPFLNMVVFVDEIRNGGVLPQVVLVKNLNFHNDETMDAIYIAGILDGSDGCYEYFDRWAFFYGHNLHFKFKKLLRIRPFKRCLDRMIKKNYYEENKSIMSHMDFELSFLGVDNFMTPRVQQIKAENPHLFGRK